LVGWCDAFFIKKWHHKHIESESNPSSILGEFKTNCKEEKVKKSINSEKHIKERSSNKLTKQQFYNEKQLIQDKYRHIQTPQTIKDDIAKLVKNDKSEIVNGISFSISHGHSIFQDSYKYRHKYIDSPKHEVFFSTYYPTFNNLTKQQKDWYFYWRTQFLQGNILKVDLSYLFIFAYELMNYSFNQHAAFNISLMEKLYKDYHPLHAKLANYLPRWIADMLIEIDEEGLALEWSGKGRVTSKPKLYKALENNEALDNIPMNTWNVYIRYGRKSKYFEAEKFRVYEAFKSNTEEFNRFKKQKNIKLIEYWFETLEYKAMRSFFNAAIIERSVSAAQEAQKQIKTTEYLRKETTAIIKLSENILRKEDGMNSFIKDYREDLQTEFVQEILMKQADDNDRFKVVKDEGSLQRGEEIPQPLEDNKKSVPLFDDIRIQSLVEDTDELVNVFDQELLDGKLEATEVSIKTDQVENLNLSLEGLFEPEESDEVKFVQTLTKLEEEFLKLFDRDNMYTISEEKALQFGQKHGMMLGVLLSAINEKAQEDLQDILIEKEEGNVYLVEGFKDIRTSI